jgi:hypothetical protein
MLRHFEGTLNMGLTSGVRTGADGRFELFFLDVPGVQRQGGVMGWNGGDMRLEPADDVVVRLER